MTMTTSNAHVERTLIITYADGSHDEFRFPPQSDSSRVAGMVDRMMSMPVLCLEIGDRLIAIPTQNIRSAEVLPAPERLPEQVITHARRTPRLS